MEVQGLLPGNKVDIRILQHVRNQTSDTEKTAYISNVYDVAEDDTILVHMPTQGGKILMLSMDLRYEFVFTTNWGLYKSVGMLQERLKKDNFYLFRIKLQGKLEKFQRREYYRLECNIPLTYFLLDEETVKLPTRKDILLALESQEQLEGLDRKGIILDISGGGVRFVCPDALEEMQYLLLMFSLENDAGRIDMELLGEKVSSEEKGEVGQYVHRIKLHFENRREQEMIIHHIFQVQRKLRKKEQG